MIVDPRLGHLEMTREHLLFALSLVWFAVYIVGLIYVIFLSERAATTFNDEPNSIARLFQLPVLQGGLLRHTDTKAEHCCRPLHLHKVQDDGASMVGQPIQFYELDRTA